MILSAIFDMLVAMVKALFSFINLPDAPVQIQNVLDILFQYLRAGINFVALFVYMDLVRVLLPVVIILVNFERVYKFVMFVVRKIPFLGIE